QAEGVPTRTVLLLGVVTAAFTAYGSLEVITSFASVAFIVIFGGTSYLAFRQRGESSVRAVPPAVGAVGALAFLPILLYDLLRRSPDTFFALVALAAVVVGVELLYFERDVLAEEVAPFVPGETAA
ncbi:MAG TPA: amino acid transporter, partial [Halobacteriales archaeon]|nr:amino acid transporter [Halobacteriales archaeon]